MERLWDMAISDAEFRYIKDFIYQQAAIDLEPGKAYLVESRLQPIARREGFASLSEMIAKLRAQPAQRSQLARGRSDDDQ